MTAGPDTEAFPTYIREMAGCTTGWSAYRPDHIAWSLTTLGDVEISGCGESDGRERRAMEKR